MRGPAAAPLAFVLIIVWRPSERGTAASRGYHCNTGHSNKPTPRARPACTLRPADRPTLRTRPRRIVGPCEVPGGRTRSPAAISAIAEVDAPAPPPLLFHPGCRQDGRMARPAARRGAVRRRCCTRSGCRPGEPRPTRPPHALFHATDRRGVRQLGHRTAGVPTPAPGVSGGNRDLGGCFENWKLGRWRSWAAAQPSRTACWAPSSTPPAAQAPWCLPPPPARHARAHAHVRRPALPSRCCAGARQPPPAAAVHQGAAPGLWQQRVVCGPYRARHQHSD